MEFCKKFKTEYVLNYRDVCVRVNQSPPQLAVDDESNEPLGTGTVVWPGAVVLSRYIIDKRLDITGVDVIELGAGCGLCGITASVCGAKSVLLTDLDFMQDHLRKNASQPNVSVCVFDWHSPSTSVVANDDSLLIGSDLLYREEDSLVLANLIKQLGCRAHFVFEYHNRMAINLFVNAFNGKCLRTELPDNMVQIVIPGMGPTGYPNATVTRHTKRSRDSPESAPDSDSSESCKSPSGKFVCRRGSILPGMPAYEDAITAGLLALGKDSTSIDSSIDNTSPSESECIYVPVSSYVLYLCCCT